MGAKSTLAPLPALPAGAERLSYESEGAKPLKSWLLLAALALLFADIIAVILLQRGGMEPRRTRAAAGAAGAAAAVVDRRSASRRRLHALQPRRRCTRSRRPGSCNRKRAAATRPTDERAIEATSKVTLGYVLTGDPRGRRDQPPGARRPRPPARGAHRGGARPPHGRQHPDRRDRVLSRCSTGRCCPTPKPLPEPALAKIDAYMKQGGLIVFDTQDYGRGTAAAAPSPGKARRRCSASSAQLDVPRLEPVPENHVLTKAFYLLRNFPGRWDGGQLWVEAQDETARARTASARRASPTASPRSS